MRLELLCIFLINVFGVVQNAPQRRTTTNYPIRAENRTVPVRNNNRGRTRFVLTDLGIQISTQEPYKYRRNEKNAAPKSTMVLTETKFEAQQRPTVIFRPSDHFNPLLTSSTTTSTTTVVPTVTVRRRKSRIHRVGGSSTTEKPVIVQPVSLERQLEVLPLFAAESITVRDNGKKRTPIGRTESVIKQVSEVTSKRTVKRLKLRNQIDAIKRRNSLTDEHEQIRETDNYPEAYKQKIGLNTNISSTTTESSPITMKTKMENVEENELSLETPRPTLIVTKRRPSYQSSSFGKRPKLAAPRPFVKKPSPTTSSTTSTAKIESTLKPNRILYSSRKNKNQLPQPTTFVPSYLKNKPNVYSARYRSETTSRSSSTNGPAYLPTIPTATTMPDFDTNDLEIITIIPSPESDHRLDIENLISESEVSTLKPVSIIEQIINTLSRNERSKSDSSTTGATNLSGTDDSSDPSAILKLTDVTTTHPTTVIERIRTSLSALQQQEQVGTTMGTTTIQDLSTTNPETNTGTTTTTTTTFINNSTYFITNTINYDTTTQSSSVHTNQYESSTTTTDEPLMIVTADNSVYETSTKQRRLDEEVPYIVIGIYPNNTIVRKYPNGTILTTSTTTTSAPTQMITENPAVRTTFVPLSTTTLGNFVDLDDDTVAPSTVRSSSSTTTTATALFSNSIWDEESSAEVSPTKVPNISELLNVPLDEITTKRPLTDEQKRDFHKLAQLEREQAAILKQLNFLTRGNYAGANPTSTGRNHLADRIISLAMERYNDPNTNRTVTTTTELSTTTNGSAEERENEAKKLVKQLHLDQGDKVNLPYGNSDEAIFAALLEEQGIRPTLPTRLTRLFSPTTTTSTSTTTNRIPGPVVGRGRLMEQGINWLLNAFAPPTKKPKRREPQTTTPTEILITESTNITPKITVNPQYKSINDLEEVTAVTNKIQIVPRTIRTTTTTTAESVVPFDFENELLTETVVTKKKVPATVPPVKLRSVPGTDQEFVRGNLLTAAVNVTRAISHFLGSALQVAAIQFSRAFSSGAGILRDYIASSSASPNVSG